MSSKSSPESLDGVEAVVYQELEQVLDPCSTFTDNPVNIIDLGLVEDVEVDGTSVTITLLPTNQMCMYMLNMSDEIQRRLDDKPGIDDVTVEQETDKIWTPVRMSETERTRRQEIFEERAEKHGLTPNTSLDEQLG